MSSQKRQAKSRSRSRSRQYRSPRYTTYVLLLTGGKYYVGKTNKPIADRYEEHVSGKLSAVWSKMHKPIRILRTFKSPREGTELTITKQYMARFGIENVRGSCYANVHLTPLQLEKLQLDIMEIRAQLDLCYNCGGQHFIYNCHKSVIKKPQRPPKQPMKDALCFGQLQKFLKEPYSTAGNLSPQSVEREESRPETKCFIDLLDTQ